IFQKAIYFLQEKNIQIAVFSNLYLALKEFIDFSNTPVLFSNQFELPKNTDFFISFGGDGTILDSLIFIGEKQIPVLGINLGRLGFLAAISQDEVIIALEAILKGSYTIDQRSLIHLDSNYPIFEDAPFALNEFTLHRKDTSS